MGIICKDSHHFERRGDDGFCMGLTNQVFFCRFDGVPKVCHISKIRRSPSATARQTADQAVPSKDLH